MFSSKCWIFVVVELFSEIFERARKEKAIYLHNWANQGIFSTEMAMEQK